LKVALIALFPNLFVGRRRPRNVMGWMNIPLDMMTITIAAISMGIAVDDTIHYIYRFREEIKTDGDYHGRHAAKCHDSIGHAMYYTSITIIIGFSILVLSNFWPTIYFGLFTGLAMIHRPDRRFDASAPAADRIQTVRYTGVDQSRS
jgi:predicted RND superfamily exporter protein